MKNELIEVIKNLTIIKNIPMEELRDHVLEGCSNTEKAKNIIAELEQRNNKNKYDDEPFWCLFLAFAYHESGEDKDNKNAEKYSSQAVEKFRRSGQPWNKALAHWMLGLFKCDAEDEQDGYKEMQSAVASFKELIEQSENSGNFTENKKRKDFLLERLEWPINFPCRLHDEDFKERGYLTLWLPAFPKVTAGPDGPIWTAPEENAFAMEIDQIKLGGLRYAIFPVTKRDKRILFHPEKQYCWAEVDGDSMNKDEPTPIEAKDMVLFYQAEVARGGSLVIASCPEENGAGYKYMIKRWDEANKRLISHSTAESGYPPIPLDEEHKILGIVSAVAKPIEKG